MEGVTWKFIIPYVRQPIGICHTTQRTQHFYTVRLEITNGDSNTGDIN